MAAARRGWHGGRDRATGGRGNNYTECAADGALSASLPPEMMDLLSSWSLRHIVHPPDRATVRLLPVDGHPAVALSCNSRVMEEARAIEEKRARK